MSTENGGSVASDLERRDHSRVEDEHVNSAAKVDPDVAGVARQAPPAPVLVPTQLPFTPQQTTDVLTEVDDLVLEYLLYRGLTRTFSQLVAERNDDRLHGLNAARVAEQVLDNVTRLDVSAVLEQWAFLEERFFSKLDEAGLVMAARLKASCLKLLLVCAAREARMDVVTSFFEKHLRATALEAEFHFDEQDWVPWFALPYTPAPHEHSFFATYFTPQWSSSLQISLENFINSVFRALPAPSLLSFTLLRDEISSLRAQNESLRVLANGAGGLSPDRGKGDRTRRTRSLRSEPKDGTVQLAKGDTVGGGDDSSYPASASENASSISPPTRDASSGKRCIAQMHTHGGAVTRVRISPDGRFVAIGAADATVKVCGLQGERAPAVEGATAPEVVPRAVGTVFCSGSVQSLDWRDDSTLAFSTSDHVVKLWDARRRALVMDFTTSPHLPFVPSIQCNPRGGTMAVSAAPAVSTANKSGFVRSGGELQIWSLAGKRVERTLPLEPMATRINDLSFNHNGSLLVAAGADGMVRVFDVATGGAIMGWPAHQGQCRHVHFSADETTVFSAGDDNLVVEWSMHRVRHALHSYQIVEPTGAAFTVPRDMALSVDGKTLGVAAGDAGVVFFDAMSSQRRGGARAGGGTSEMSRTESAEDLDIRATGKVNSELSARGALLLGAEASDSAGLLDPEHATFHSGFGHRGGVVQSLHFGVLESDSVLLTGGSDGVISLWEW